MDIDMVLGATTAPTVLDFAQYGLLGLLVVALILGWLIPMWAYKRLEAENARLLAENADLRRAYEEKVIPTMTRAIEILASLDRGMNSGWK